MRFDNAFLTSRKNVGMQFVKKGETFTVYRNHKNELVCSEHATPEQQIILMAQYHRRENWYHRSSIRHADDVQ